MRDPSDSGGRFEQPSLIVFSCDVRTVELETKIRQDTSRSVKKLCESRWQRETAHVRKNTLLTVLRARGSYLTSHDARTQAASSASNTKAKELNVIMNSANSSPDDAGNSNSLVKVSLREIGCPSTRPLLGREREEGNSISPAIRMGSPPIRTSQSSASLKPFSSYYIPVLPFATVSYVMSQKTFGFGMVACFRVPVHATLPNAF